MERAPTQATEVVALGRPEIDLAGDADAVVSAIADARPDVLVSAAAYTLVDKAETEPDAVYAVNERGARAVARAAAKLSVPLIHLSTDYVFDGSKNSPYDEVDVTAPAGVYGASKLAGERAIVAEHDDCAILRTAWIYSPFGNNFVKTMLRLAADRGEVRVVADQRGNPTSALDIADGILKIGDNLRRGGDPAQRGVFHMTASGEASWAEFAEAVFAASRDLGGPSAGVRHISTADYPTAAKRPHNSRLDSSKLERAHGVRLPEWWSSLPAVVSRLVQANGSGE
jgi:dTDP-4-dehydrorhamnose reductase